jgi:hypothetical protein
MVQLAVEQRRPQPQVDMRFLRQNLIAENEDWRDTRRYCGLIEHPFEGGVKRETPLPPKFPWHDNWK